MPAGREFDQVAQRYDRARPDYPAELFEELVRLTGIGSGSELLEVGSGTGKATVPLAALGCRITCLEPGLDLAAMAAAKIAAERPGATPGPAAPAARPGSTPAAGPAVEIVPSTLEDWQAGGRQFDLVSAATSWHWTDPAVRYRKAAALLRPGGALAFRAAMHGFPSGYDRFREERCAMARQ